MEAQDAELVPLDLDHPDRGIEDPHPSVPVVHVVGPVHLQRFARLQDHSRPAQASLDRRDLREGDVPVLSVLVPPVQHLVAQHLVRVPRHVAGEGAPEAVLDGAVEARRLGPRPRRRSGELHALDLAPRQAATVAPRLLHDESQAVPVRPGDPQRLSSRRRRRPNARTPPARARPIVLAGVGAHFRVAAVGAQLQGDAAVFQDRHGRQPPEADRRGSPKGEVRVLLVPRDPPAPRLDRPNGPARRRRRQPVLVVLGDRRRPSFKEVDPARGVVGPAPAPLEESFVAVAGNGRDAAPDAVLVLGRRRAGERGRGDEQDRCRNRDQRRRGGRWSAGRAGGGVARREPGHEPRPSAKLEREAGGSDHDEPPFTPLQDKRFPADRPRSGPQRPWRSSSTR